MFDTADRIYQYLVHMVYRTGDLVTARNAQTRRVFDADPVTFYATPLVTLRKTAWRLAIREMEWFLSSDAKCPQELLPWWQTQLNPEGFYISGYRQQLRAWCGWFDQIEYLIDGLKEHPTSRRHLLTTWNASDMANITTSNANPNTPACCHTTLAQFFVRDNRLYMTSYQRSADLLLGFQHNIIQTWALLMWIAHQTNLSVGSLRWLLGDCHIYTEPSHLEVAKAVMECDLSKRTLPPPKLIYNGNGDFRALDFEMIGEIEEPTTTVRPKLL